MMSKLTKRNGFTLVELMVVIAIIGVIMAYAIPSYKKQVIRTKRTEAQAVLLELAAIQERHNSVYQQYAITVIGTTETADNLGKDGSSKYVKTKNYKYTLDIVSGGYKFEAKARSGSSQKDDKTPLFTVDCTKIYINQIGRKWPTACWQ